MSQLSIRDIVSTGIKNTIEKIEPLHPSHPSKYFIYYNSSTVYFRIDTSTNFRRFVSLNYPIEANNNFGFMRINDSVYTGCEIRGIYLHKIKRNFYFLFYSVINHGITSFYYDFITNCTDQQKIIDTIFEVLDNYIQFKKRDIETDESLWNRIILDKDLKNDIITDFNEFIKSKNQYKDLQLPWKRGYLFSGPPGNGKTLLLRLINRIYGFNVRNLMDFVDQYGELNLKHEYSHLPQIMFDLDFDVLHRHIDGITKPRVYYIEDIDKVVGRNQQDHSKLNLASLLNSIDGFNQLGDGLILIATTNYLEDLVDAVVGRPGRFDRVFHFKNPEDEQIKEILNYYKVIIKPKSDTKEIIKELNGFSMAFIEEFIKSAKVKTKSNLISYDIAKSIIKRMHEHTKIKDSIKNKIGL